MGTFRVIDQNTKDEIINQVRNNGMNLRMCGIDLACADITEDTDNYSVIEVNSTPGIDHYASTGQVQQEIVDNLYAKVINNM
jgi:glutathione synthase/RimK-type ligase-like ATP-grasp enzyme